MMSPADAKKVAEFVAVVLELSDDHQLTYAETIAALRSTARVMEDRAGRPMDTEEINLLASGYYEQEFVTVSVAAKGAFIQ